MRFPFPRRERLSTLIAIAALAGGIGVAATLATLVRQVILRPFPFAEPERLALIWASDPERAVPRLELAWADVEAIAAEQGSFDGVAAWSAANFGVVVAAGERPVQLQGNVVSAGFFPVLGVEPTLGRRFTAEERWVGGPGAALLADSAWRRVFGADPAAVGRTVKVEGQPVTIVGVLPAGLGLPAGAEIVFPLEPGQSDEASRKSRVLVGVGRLAAGATIAAATDQAAATIGRLERERPEALEHLGAKVEPLVGALLGDARPALTATGAMSLLVLVVAILNVAGIRLHALLGRREELAVRSALGASAGDLAGLLVRESIAIAALGAILGAGLAKLLLDGFLAFAPASFPRLDGVGFETETALAALAASAVAAAVLALLPLAVLGRVDEALAGPLRSAGRGGGPGRGSRRSLDALAAGQVALAAVLLVVAGVTARSFAAWAAIDVGFSTDRVLTAHLALPYTLGEEAEKRRAEFDALLARVRAIPGVRAAGSVLMRPLEMVQGWDMTFTTDGQSFAEQEGNPLANLLVVTPGYVEAMGMRLAAGRALGDADRVDGEAVAVVSEGLARRFWSEPQAALGQRLKSGKPDSDRPWLTVVGVVADVRSRGLEVEKLDVYLPFTQSFWSPNYLAVATRGDPAAILPSVEAAVAAVFPEVPLARPRTTAELVAEKLAPPRLHALALALFALAAVGLTAVGLFGVLAYGVRRRRRELGIRAALGADRRRLVGAVGRRALALGGGGLVAGLGLALPLALPLVERLYGVGDGLPWAVVGATAGVVALSVLAAAAAPAVAAAAADPLTVLRDE